MRYGSYSHTGPAQVFLHLQPRAVRRSMGRLPTTDDFPPKVKLNIVPPPANDAPTNILILLHGLGDTNESFTHLAKQMNLPETCCISLQGPQPVLDLGGYHFGDDIIFSNNNNDNNTSGLDIDSGFQQSSQLLHLLIHEILLQKCNFRLRDILLLGFGQGGMAALTTAVHIDQSHIAKDPALVELGGVISIGAGLADETPAELDPKCRTPVLVCAGSGGSIVTRGVEDKLRRVFQYVEMKRYRRVGDGMPGNRDEMLPIMQFFSRRLRSRKGVPEGAVEVL